MKRSHLLLTTLLVVAVIGGIVLYQAEKPYTSDLPGYNNGISTSSPTASTKPATATPKPTAAATNTGSLLLKVPFTAQAPTGNWDKEHNEACEEASALMVGAYFKGDTRTKIPAAEVEKELTRLFEWERANFGYSLDTTAAQTAEMIRAVYGLDAEVVRDYTESQIKKALQENKLVIIAAAGRKLGNPNYTAPGPLYHMLVVRGYNGSTIITNDPGTRNGESYAYSFSTLKNASADWDHATGTIDSTKSVMIVVSK